MEEFNIEIAKNVTKELIDVGFEIDKVWYDSKHFGNFGVSLILQDDKPIFISMSRDRIYWECRITKEQFLIKSDKTIDSYHFFPENDFVEDLFNALGIEVPEIPAMNNDNITVMQNDKNILLLMELYSVAIAKNINLIKHSLEKENIVETKRKMDIASKERNSHGQKGT